MDAYVFERQGDQTLCVKSDDKCKADGVSATSLDTVSYLRRAFTSSVTCTHPPRSLPQVCTIATQTLVATLSGRWDQWRIQRGGEGGLAP